MNRVEYDATAKLATRAVTLAIVLRRMPVGQVLTHFHSSGDNPADGAIRQKSLHNAQARMKPQIARHKGNQIAFSYQLEQFLDPLPGMRERLFNKQMTTMPCGIQCHRHMQR